MFQNLKENTWVFFQIKSYKIGNIIFISIHSMSKRHQHYMYSYNFSFFFQNIDKIMFSNFFIFSLQPRPGNEKGEW